MGWSTELCSQLGVVPMLWSPDSFMDSLETLCALERYIHRSVVGCVVSVSV